MIKTYLARRPCEIGEEIRWPDAPVPEAHLWRLNEGLVRAGVLLEIQMTEADFETAVGKYCPDEADAIYGALGLTPVDHSAMKRGTRPRKAKPVLVTEPVALPQPTPDV